MFNNNNDGNGKINNGKVRRYVHSPTTMEHDGVKVEIKEDGKITLTQKSIDDDSKEEFEDVIETSAGLITKIKEVLKATRKVHWVDKV